MTKKMRWQPFTPAATTNSSYFGRCPRNDRGWCESSGEGGGSGGSLFRRKFKDSPEGLAQAFGVHPSTHKDKFGQDPGPWRSGEDPNRRYGWHVKASGVKLDRLVGEFLDRARKLGFKWENDREEPGLRSWQHRQNVIELSHPEGHAAEVEYNKSRADFRLHWTAPRFREGVAVSKEAYDAFPVGHYGSTYLMLRARAGNHRAAMESHNNIIRSLNHRLNGTDHQWNSSPKLEGKEAERARQALALHQIARDYHMEKAGLQ